MSHAPTTVAETGTSPAPRANVIVAVLAFAGIVVSLMQSLIIPIIPELPALLHASASDAAWAITATLLAAAVATPTMGRLGDMYGKRRMLLVSVVALVAGSVIGALTDSLGPMIVARALQGFSAGVIALGISIMRDELPSERLGSSIALMSASLGVGGALGLPAAAFLAENADWHVLFWASAALGAVALLLVVFLVPESQVRTGGRFDYIGSAGLSVSLVCLLLAISKGADWGWTSGLTLGLFAATVAVLLVWGAWELRTTDPIVDLRTAARRQVVLTNAASLVFGFAMFAMTLVLPQLLQLPEATGYGLERGLMTVGLVMAPSGLIMMAMAPVSASISRTRTEGHLDVWCRRGCGRVRPEHGADVADLASGAGVQHHRGRDRPCIRCDACTGHGGRAADRNGCREQPEHADAFDRYVGVERCCGRCARRDDAEHRWRVGALAGRVPRGHGRRCARGVGGARRRVVPSGEADAGAFR